MKSVQGVVLVSLSLSSLEFIELTSKIERSCLDANTENAMKMMSVQNLNNR